MSEFRSAAEIFLARFLDYVYKHDIKDEFNKRTQKMERSPGVATLIKEAEQASPRAADGADGKQRTDALTTQQVDEAMKATPNVIDRREDFGRRIQLNGGTRKLLQELFDGEPGARVRVEEFLSAENGIKKFDEPVS